METTKKFYEKTWYLVFSIEFVVIEIAIVILFELEIMTSLVSIILLGFIAAAFMPGCFCMFRDAIKNKRVRVDEDREKIFKKYLLRGKNLDHAVEIQFSRNENEKDWDYVKRIFPLIYEDNPVGAVNILFGKSILDLDDIKKEFAESALSFSDPQEIKNFLNGFKKDPAY